ncbi:MAG: magnesium chelatase ATPase subunit I [Deltaproteobacteria bacterium CG12_big_fil_rev_8_21_14_0_65_43_10]|nr:MAG: magnesium chelatase ATPase subunit I [Deltaproteobacteria bacterium CG12_big_fil_rev_8_21_14_0_65_43_10]PIU85217.1 MAG: magnesium chelatase ATPase subunit I [Deltaproteobacteria bacterium CG06_land_8_20_14_3_00_44_19]PIX26337.1 MAG: magnesium chelatase ATPase subunit I [Deltaproteobacteria bacterium CG_4_8_14_3_um_filter_43_13]PIZ18685.1 MAG: magnesium chelatase ATPase subunit I [Deltaproteobacteria bacterium CG_4_10_14_0_8_um_filter_43_12]
MKKNKLIYPFAAIVGQENMKLALILNIINPTLSGVLIRGEKGTAKSTAVRALADVLPEIEVFENDPFQLAPEDEFDLYRECMLTAYGKKISSLESVKRVNRKVRVVELPVGATEDRVVGTLDLEHALKKGEKQIEPGILAAAHRGILYVDEVNLLDDHVVDVLLDSAAMGVNTIEREGVSFSHPARFTLVGTMNPEEGELRPQLLDRFGLCVLIEGVRKPEDRVAIMERRAAFDEDPAGFCKQWEETSKELAERIGRAAALYPEVVIDRPLLFEITSFCLDVGVDGHRGDIIMLKTAKTLAAWHGRREVVSADIGLSAELVLPHRVRRQPLMEIADNIQAVRERRRGSGR